MRSKSVSLSALGMALLLSGCHSVFGMHFAENRVWKRMQIRPVGATAAVSDQKTQAARAALDAGNLATAIASFREAMNAGEKLPPVLNGLGVAYARLGRLDMAYTYFQQAVAQAPDEPRYRDNLAMLMQAQEFVAAEQARARLAADKMILADKGADDPHMTQANGSKLERISRTEVHIVTAPAQTAPRYSPTQLALNSGSSVIRIVAISTGTVNVAKDAASSEQPSPIPPEVKNAASPTTAKAGGPE